MVVDFSRCRTPSCDALIIWVLSEKGKRMPLDAEPVDPSTPNKGTFVKSYVDDKGNGVVHAMHHDETTTKPRYTSHFATCPAAAEHRKS